MSRNRPASRVLTAVISLQLVAIAVLLLQLVPGDGAVTASGPADALPTDAPARLSAAEDSTPGPSAPRAPSVAAAPEPQAPAAPPSGTLLYGTLRDDSDQPLTSGVVWFSRPGTPRPIATVSIGRGVSEFALAGLEAGEVTYRTRIDGHKEVSGRVEIPADAVRLRHDIVVPKTWQLHVRIDTPQGEPLHKALEALHAQRSGLQQVEVGVVATRAAPQGDFPPTAFRESDYGVGRWRSVTSLEARLQRRQPPAEGVAGVLELDVRQPLWVSAVLRHRVLTTAAVEPGQSEVRLLVGVEQLLGDLGVIRGRIVDHATGAPVADAQVGFNDRQSGGPSTKSGADGRFEARDLRPGLLTVEAHKDMRVAQSDLVTLLPGQVLELGDVPLFTRRKIEGRCENVQGKPESARITYQALDPPSHPALQRRRDGPSLAADGSFTLYLVEGRYHLWVLGAGAAMQEVDTRALGSQPLVVRLAAEAPLRMVAAPGDAVWQVALFAGESELTRRTLAGGATVPLPMPLGTYRVELVGPDGTRRVRTIEVGAAGLELAIPFD